MVGAIAALGDLFHDGGLLFGMMGLSFNVREGVLSRRGSFFGGGKFLLCVSNRAFVVLLVLEVADR